MSIFFSCEGAAISSRWHHFGVFSIEKNGNQEQKLMSITVIFNGNYLIKSNSPRQIKIPLALNEAKSVILLIFHLKIQIQGQ